MVFCDKFNNVVEIIKEHAVNKKKRVYTLKCKGTWLYNFYIFRGILSFFGLLCLLSTGYDVIVSDSRKLKQFKLAVNLTK